MNPRLRALLWFIGPLLNQNRGRNAAAILAIAAGVALALAIHIVNQTAVSEFQRSVAKINGLAQLQIKGKETYFSEAVYAVVANEVALQNGLREASPVIELDTSTLKIDAKSKRIQLVGIDFMRAAAVTPNLLGRPSKDARSIFDAAALFGTIKSAEKTANLNDVTLNTPSGPMYFNLAGPNGLEEENRLVGDIAQVQILFGLEGKLSRIDLLLSDNASLADMKSRLEKRLPDTVRIVEPDQEKNRMSNLSRAYRVNLSVLALVALVTGGLIVFSSQAAMVLKQWSMLALVSLLGASRRWLMFFVLGQGLVVGAIGTVVGLLLGYGLAAALLSWVGTDLGGGYFAGTKALPRIAWSELLVFAAMGLAISLIASWLPARSALKARRAEALKPGHGEITLGQLPAGWPAFALALLGCFLAFVPAIGGLPLAGYAAIACWLFAGVAAVPWLTKKIITQLCLHLSQYAWKSPPAWLALHRTGQSPGLAVQAIAGVVASMALVTAMAIMVSSFRSSVSSWLDQILPAQLYARLPAGAAQLQLPEQQLIANQSFIQRSEFLRSVDVSLDNARAAVPILVRKIDVSNPNQSLPISGAIMPLTADQLQAGVVPLYVSEAMVSLYGMSLGSIVTLPLKTLPTQLQNGISREKPQFKVVAVWRDYARQTGALQMDQTDYRRLTGDKSATDIALWLKPGITEEIAGDALQKLDLKGRTLEWRSSAEIRALSLTIFDRSFAVTYALEAAAIIVALIGVAASFGAQALARQKEFAVLTHLGAKPQWLDLQLALEGGLLTLAGAIWGTLLGFAMSWILIDRVNPQSFHWTMDTDVPWLALTAGIVILSLCAAACSGWAGRRGRALGHLQTIKQDW